MITRKVAVINITAVCPYSVLHGAAFFLVGLGATAVVKAGDLLTWDHGSGFILERIETNPTDRGSHPRTETSWIESGPWLVGSAVAAVPRTVPFAPHFPEEKATMAVGDRDPDAVIEGRKHLVPNEGESCE